MARFWIDYQDSVLIAAETQEEAERLFWDEFLQGILNSVVGTGDTTIYCIEEEEEEEI